MFTFVRIECVDHGNGPYNNMHDGNTCRCSMFTNLHSASGAHQPTPNGDNGIMRSMNDHDRCAFLDVEQAARWFAPGARGDGRYVWATNVPFRAFDSVSDAEREAQRVSRLKRVNGRSVWGMWDLLDRMGYSKWVEDVLDKELTTLDGDYALVAYEIPSPFLTGVGECQILVNLAHAHRIAQMNVSILTEGM